MRQERERDVLEVEVDLRGQQLIVLLQRFFHDVLPDEALQHIVHVIKHLADLPQNRWVIEPADGVVGQLLRCDLATGQTTHIDDGDNLFHAGGPCALDAVVAGHNLKDAILLCQEGQALKLAAVLDVRRKLVSCISFFMMRALISCSRSLSIWTLAMISPVPISYIFSYPTDEVLCSPAISFPS